uniref:Interleukin-12 beta central domain-containing protein n=2 Tax=Takifugu rubripes TaxID=31033 RepID=A0A3B5KM56_TAKRU
NILSLWIFGLLFISSSEVHGLSSIPENCMPHFVLAKELNGLAILTCNSTPDTAITWKFNDVPVENEAFGQYTTQNGPDLNLSQVDFTMFGNYSCWSEGRMLSSVYLLEIEEPEQTFLKNQAISHDGLQCKSSFCFFSCSAKRLKSCQWVTSSGPVHGGGFQFQLSHSLSPYAEENTKLEVTVEAIDDLIFDRKTKKFFLREIIQPNSPKIAKCEDVGENLMVTIEPPSNWSTPHSFFTLEHQIHYRLLDNNQDRFSSSTLIPKTASSLRVRSRDSLILSTWSQWSPWKNLTQSEKCLSEGENSYSINSDSTLLLTINFPVFF